MNENEYYNQIKDLIINNEITRKVKEYSINKSDLETKYEIGKILSDAGKHYGESIIKNFSIKLTQELGKGYDITSLKRMRQFYSLIEKGAPLVHQLRWSHYIQLLPIENINELEYYIKLIINQRLTKNNLIERIKSKEYERLPSLTKSKLIHNESINIKESIPEPIIIKVNSNIDKEKISEKALHSLILEDIESFMKQIGEGYTFVGSEYKIKLGCLYNYIDLLLFNYIYNSFVVVELKVTELKSEHIGQIEKYVNYIDKNVKTIYHNKTIGIILVRKNNQFVIDYSTDESIIARTYELSC